MAYTKIITVKSRLDRSIDYAVNPEKTSGLETALGYIENSGKTEKQLYVTALNCQKETAFEEMTATKKRWKKHKRKNLGYHIIQSFAPGEVTPDVAHEIGRKFAERLLGGNYEAVVSTHLDRGHLHNHLVFSSVSCFDGSMYRSTFKNYYDGIRGISDELCREYGLSVIEPKDRGKHYAEWKAEKESQPTIRSNIRNDIDYIISQSLTFKSFLENLKRTGYKVKYGDNVKHMALKPPGGERFIRLSSLKDERYTEHGIRARILRQQETGDFSKPQQKSKNKAVYRCRGSIKAYKRVKLHGFKALYFRYLYLLGKVRKKQAPRKKSRYLMAEIQKFNRYVSQYKFLAAHNIETVTDLETRKSGISARIEELKAERRPLYAKRKEVEDEDERQDVSREIWSYTNELRELRRELYTCRSIEKQYPAIQERLRQSETVKKELTKEEKAHESRRGRGRSGSAGEHTIDRGGNEIGGFGR